MKNKIKTKQHQTPLKFEMDIHFTRIEQSIRCEGLKQNFVVCYRCGKKYENEGTFEQESHA